MTPVNKISASELFDIYSFDDTTELKLYLFENGISAGYPSPTGDISFTEFDLNKDLIKCPVATFFVRLVGDKLESHGMKDNDLLIVDRSVDLFQNAIIVSVINNAFEIRQVDFKDDGVYFLPLYGDGVIKKFEPEKEIINSSSMLWGVVIYTIRKV